MRWAFKVAYLGRPFHGFARQPTVPTVEGRLAELLRQGGFLPSGGEPGIQGASRTDRGVNALGNVITATLSADPREVLAYVNREPSPIWMWAYAAVSESFRPRHAEWRWYRYQTPTWTTHDGLQRAANRFLGTHDFRGFAKGGGGVCTLRALEVRAEGGWTLLDFRGDRFLWQMVRRIVAALMAYGRGDLTMADLSAGLEGEVLSLRPADPRRLCLMEVHHDLDWQRSGDRTLPPTLAQRTVEAQLEGRFFRSLKRSIERSQ